jgi:hypothetical protein
LPISSSFSGARRANSDLVHLALTGFSRSASLDLFGDAANFGVDARTPDSIPLDRTAGDQMKSIANHCVLVSALLACATSVPVWADAVNGQKLFDGLPSARFPAGSYACVTCHGLGPGDRDPMLDAAGKPDLIDAAINTSFTSFRQMKPIYGAGGTSVLTTADEQDLADYLEAFVNGMSEPNFAVSPASATFAGQSVGTQSAPVTFTVLNNGSTGTLSSVSSSDNTEFLIAGGTCITTPVTLAQNESCTVLVVFAPTVLGARNSTITILDNGSPSPLIINATGTGSPSAPNGPGTKVTIVEYYEAAIDHYFITPLTSEIALCDAGVSPCLGWVRTGLTFNGFDAASPPASSIGVCRFFNDSFAPKSSHFYALHGLGCEDTIADFPDWQLESSDLFNMYIPDAAGNCPSGSIPVYRLFNNGMGGAPNHRFVTSLADRIAMVDKGYVSEGYGPLGVGMCAPL